MILNIAVLFKKMQQRAGWQWRGKQGGTKARQTNDTVLMTIVNMGTNTAIVEKEKRVWMQVTMVR